MRTYRPHLPEEADIPEPQRPGRSTLTKDEARRRYVQRGELAALEQIRADAGPLDRQEIAIGPFARLDAGAVAARDGKTRGSVTNLFGSQARFQVETMALALSAGEWIETITYPAPEDHPTADAWLTALLIGESARGPQHGAAPASTYGFLWALWLTTVPYGIWSREISGPSMAEHALWVEKLDAALAAAVTHFQLTMHKDTSVRELAAGLASLIEGMWLNQCLTDEDPSSPGKPVATALLRAGRLLWRGAMAT